MLASLQIHFLQTRLRREGPVHYGTAPTHACLLNLFERFRAHPESAPEAGVKKYD
jgi:hypothetical protein